MVPSTSSGPAGGLWFPEIGLQGDRARVLVVVPPFASPDCPSIGAHIIARVAAERGFVAEVVYANLSFAARIGVRDYSRLCGMTLAHLLGERIFSPALYGDKASAELDEEAEAYFRDAVRDSPQDFAALQALACEWADYFAGKLAETPAEIIGFSSTFEQTLSSLSLIERIKRSAPYKTLIIGGANVDGAMANAVAELSTSVDHVFSGESECSFGRFLDRHERKQDSPRIIVGTPNVRLNEIPAPDYSAFVRQLGQTVAADRIDGGLAPDEIWFPYESSRGCWWGAKHHCTFCGLNALGMGYREKDSGKVLDEILCLAHRHGGGGIMMVDNIMPFSYFSTLLPELARRGDGPQIFYEQKANLSFARMRLLKQAGVTRIQPGIESLDTSVLKLMRKGSTLRINLECLRYARVMRITLAWNLLVDFPHENDQAYEAMAALIPLLGHLEPPSAATPLSIERFSPYFDERDAFGIENVRPFASYAAAFPGLADTSAIAYHFQADYPSTLRRRPDLIKGIAAQVESWRRAWLDPETVPMLEVVHLSEGRYLICDTRPCAKVHAEILDRDQACFCLTGKGSAAHEQWALDRNFAWAADGEVLPLAVTSEASLLEFLPVAPPVPGLAAASST
ncbi:MAG TPA: RiPP maturation radical SAM C-methyltransferase [Allosphingosinicella sp.]|jgi:ribosomal peptide maturation radical SAM protein 1